MTSLSKTVPQRPSRIGEVVYLYGAKVVNALSITSLSSTPSQVILSTEFIPFVLLTGERNRTRASENIQRHKSASTQVHLDFVALV